MDRGPSSAEILFSAIRFEKPSALASIPSGSIQSMQEKYFPAVGKGSRLSLFFLLIAASFYGKTRCGSNNKKQLAEKWKSFFHYNGFPFFTCHHSKKYVLILMYPPFFVSTFRYVTPFAIFSSGGTFSSTGTARHTRI